MTTLDTKQPVCLPSLKILSDYWTLRIIDALSDAALRFCEIERAVPEGNSASLTKRLKSLQGAGIIERNEHNRADVTYSLTPLGKEALPLLDAVNHYALAAQEYARS